MDKRQDNSNGSKEAAAETAAETTHSIEGESEEDVRSGWGQEGSEMINGSGW